jgi:hypothetical protein
LRLHHDKFNEALGKLPRLRAGLDFGHGLKLTDPEQEHEHDYDLSSFLVLMIAINSYLSGGRTVASTYGCF